MRLIALLKKLPGVGSRTAERFAFHLLDWSAPQLEEFGDSVGHIKSRIHACPECHCLMDGTRCAFCDPAKLRGRGEYQANHQ